MPFRLPDEGFEEVIECWGISPNTIEVIVGPNKRHDHQHVVRITALENVKSSAAPRYSARYEEPVTITDHEGNEHEVWVETRYPWEMENTIDETLVGALRWVTIGDE